MRLSVTFAVGLSAVAAAAAFSAPAPAAPLSLKALLDEQLAIGRGPSQPVIGRYEMDEGGGFVFDRSTPKPLLKFQDDPEIWVLQASVGARGDTVYKNDLGEPMIRATRMGEMTVFTPSRPMGSPAALAGASRPLRLAPLSSTALFNRFFQASVRVSRAAQHQVGFETHEDAEPITAAYLGDAALVASEALVSVASQTGGRAALARVNAVVIAQGPKPAANLRKGVLTITITPSEGLAGRPSSRRIERAAVAR
jgi:hypothetical protein